MNILFASSEVFPYSKTGGLADMGNFLPKALNKIGHNVVVVTPYYKQVSKYHDEMIYIGSKTIYFGDEQTVVHYFKLNKNGFEVIFVQNQGFFERENFYGYDDDAERFIVFSYAILELVDLLDFIPQIIHVNDWQSATVPFLLDSHYRNKDKYRFIHTLLTIHNLEHQGNFNLESSKYFNRDFDYTYVHFGNINYLKTGIERASKINTVSPNYRNETLSQEYGFTLDGSLRKRERDYIGVLNGIDQNIFDPSNDHLIAKNYTTRNLKLGKKANKKSILEYFKIEANLDLPLVSYIGRLATQKGISFMEQSLEDIIVHSNAYLIILGSGEERYASYFQYLRDKYPSRVGFYNGYNENLAHEIYAASDIFLMPSIFEPCGLGQMMAMRYGTIPVVRETGGLKDTVIPYNKYKNTGTGFTFYDQKANIFKDKVFEAIDLFNENPRKWSQLIRRAMKNDFGLDLMAKTYSNIYQKIVEGK